MKRITIKDIAKLANVNPSSVSRALNNSEKISPSLREKIKSIAESLNFTLNTNAVNFKNRKTKVIALIIPRIGMFFTPTLINGISKALNEKNYRLTIYISDDDYDKEVECINNCIENDVDGILISLSQKTQSINHLLKTKELDIPVVITDKTISQDEFSEVIFNNYQDSIRCAQYLANYKIKNILGVFGNPDLMITKERLRGFNKIFNHTPHHIIYADTSKDAELKSMKIHLQDFDAYFCMSDEVLLGLLSSYSSKMTEDGARHFISFSDGNLPQYILPKVNYLHHNGEELGLKAVEVLLQHISSSNSNRQTIFINSKIITPFLSPMSMT